MKFITLCALLGLTQANGIIADIDARPTDKKISQTELKEFKGDTYYSGYITVDLEG